MEPNFTESDENFIAEMNKLNDIIARIREVVDQFPTPDYVKQTCEIAKQLIAEANSPLTVKTYHVFTELYNATTAQQAKAHLLTYAQEDIIKFCRDNSTGKAASVVRENIDIISKELKKVMDNPEQANLTRFDRAVRKLGLANKKKELAGMFMFSIEQMDTIQKYIDAGVLN